MKFGVFLPISGRASGPDTLMEAARSAEELGFDAVWSADRVVTPWQISTLIMGVGVGWMEEEFAAQGILFKDRGRMTDEQLEIISRLWTEEHISFNGQFYRFQDLAFYPKPIQQPRIPIWVGGEGVHAQRRTAKYGDAWFPYFVEITPAELKAGYDNVLRLASAAGRDPEQVLLTCCRPIEVTRQPVPQDDRHLRGTPEQLVEALNAYREIGVDHLALQFMAPRWPERVEQIERFAREAMPHLRD